MYKFALIAFALFGVSSAIIKDCTRGALAPQPSSITITGCPDPNVTCRIVRGRDITGLIDFVSVSDAVTLRPEITAYAFSVRAVYELPADRQIGCNWISGTSCPLSQGEFATYALNMPVTDEYPLTTLDIEIRMYDQNDVLQFCVLIDSEVVLN